MAKKTLCVVAPRLRPGGLLEHVRCVVAGAHKLNIEVVLFSDDQPPGLVAPHEARSVQELEAVAATIASSDVTLVVLSPETALFLPLLASAKSCLVGVHGTPGSNAKWLGPALAGAVRLALTCMSGVRIAVPGQTYREGVASEFGIPEDRVVALPNAVTAISVPANPGDTAVIRELTVPMRLDIDKFWIAEAAISLADAMGVPLHFVGVGRHAPQLRELLSRESGVHWTVTLDEDVVEHMRCADLVVGVGLVAIEGILRARPVAVPSKYGGFAGAVTPSNFEQHRGSNFCGWGMPTVADPSLVATEIRSMDRSDLELLSDMAGREAAPSLMLSRMELAASAPGPVDAPGLQFGSVVVSTTLQSELQAQLHAALEARDWWQAQHEHLAQANQESLAAYQAALSDYQKALDDYSAVCAARDWVTSQHEQLLEAYRKALDDYEAVCGARDWWRAEFETLASQGASQGLRQRSSLTPPDAGEPDDR